MEWEGYNHTGVYNVLFMCLPFRHSCEVLPTHNNPGSIQNSVRMFIPQILLATNNIHCFRYCTHENVMINNLEELGKQLRKTRTKRLVSHIGLTQVKQVKTYNLLFSHLVLLTYLDR